MNQAEQIMTMYEVAEYLHIHLMTVRRLARDGELPAIKIGRLWRVQKDVLDRWMETQAQQNLGKNPQP